MPGLRRLCVGGASVLTLMVAAGAASVSAQSSVELVDSVMAALAESEPGRITPLLDDRVRLSVEGVEHDGVTPRQATAELERFLGAFEASKPTTVRSGGQPDETRAFAELSWNLLSVRTEEVHPFVVFLGLELRGQRWLINEIRILRQV